MWKKINYQIQGRGHEKDNIPCQDKTYAIKKNGVHCIALADGAGSAKLSHIGADIAVRVASEYLCTNFEKALNDEDGINTKKEFIKVVYESLMLTAEELRCEIRDLASTLMIVAIKGDDYILFHIGDGVVGAYRNGEVEVISWPVNGEYAGSTVFTTSSNVSNYLVGKRKKLDGIEGFVLMSDGTGDSFYDKNTKTLVPSTRNFFEYLKSENEEAMEELVDNTFREVISKKTFDDCSICLILVGEDEVCSAYELNYETLCERLGIYPNPYLRSRKRLNRYKLILDYTKEPRTINEISSKLKLRSKYTKKVVDRLVEKEALEIDGIYYVCKEGWSV